MKKCIILLCVFGIAGIAGCGDDDGSTSALEQEKTEANQSRLLKTQPPISMDWSLEREQLNKRTKLWNDKNKVSYIYLLEYGRIMAFYTIKGKVSSVNSQITNPAQIVSRGNSHHRYSGVLPSPAEDGSYGSNGDAVFFFTTGGTYVEWNGTFMLCDQPLKLSQQPLMTLEVKE